MLKLALGWINCSTGKSLTIFCIFLPSTFLFLWCYRLEKQVTEFIGVCKTKGNWSRVRTGRSFLWIKVGVNRFGSMRAVSGAQRLFSVPVIPWFCVNTFMSKHAFSGCRKGTLTTGKVLWLYWRTAEAVCCIRVWWLSPGRSLSSMSSCSSRVDWVFISVISRPCQMVWCLSVGIYRHISHWTSTILKFSMNFV